MGCFSRYTDYRLYCSLLLVAIYIAAAFGVQCMQVPYRL